MCIKTIIYHGMFIPFPTKFRIILMMGKCSSSIVLLIRYQYIAKIKKQRTKMTKMNASSKKV